MEVKQLILVSITAEKITINEAYKQKKKYIG